ncbi:hypothetical protein Gotur_032368 [Gossypium turneri]
MQTGEESMFKIETKAIFEGLKITWDFYFRRVEVECGNALIVEAILTSGATNSRMSKLCLIHQFLGRDWRVHLRHISRGHDKVTNYMAKLPSLYCNEVQIFKEMSMSKKKIIEDKY